MEVRTCVHVLLDDLMGDLDLDLVSKRGDEYRPNVQFVYLHLLETVN